MNIFVYGTLRPGEYNARSEFVGLASEIKKNVTTTGRMWNRHGDDPYYPVVDFNQQGSIIGDLLVDMPERHEAVRSVHRMEIGAGYELQEITVETPDGPYKAIAYNFEVDRRGRMVGQEIPAGDWLAFTAAYREFRDRQMSTIGADEDEEGAIGDIDFE